MKSFDVFKQVRGNLIPQRADRLRHCTILRIGDTGMRELLDKEVRFFGVIEGFSFPFAKQLALLRDADAYCCIHEGKPRFVLHIVGKTCIVRFIYNKITSESQTNSG